jgi:hypothetical protein
MGPHIFDTSGGAEEVTLSALAAFSDLVDRLLESPIACIQHK